MYKGGTILDALERLADRTPGVSVPDNLRDYAENLVDGLAVYQNAVSRSIGQDKSWEQLQICYTVGTLEFVMFDEGGKGKAKTPYGLLDMELFNLDGKLNGHYQVVWKPQVPGGDDINEVPAPIYKGPWNRIEKKIPEFQMRANSNAAYRFDGHGGTGKGTLYATGPANLLITTTKDGGKMFQISVATFVTDGTGDFAGSRGTNTALGSTFFSAQQAAGVDFSNPPLDIKFPGVTVSTFRFVPGKNQK